MRLPGEVEGKFGCGVAVVNVKLEMEFQSQQRGWLFLLLPVVYHLGISWSSAFLTTHHLLDYQVVGILCTETSSTFFGLGLMVGMLKYSPVMTYNVSVPPQKLEFSSSINKEWLKEEFQNLYTERILLFTEVESSLKQISPLFVGSTLNLRGSFKEFYVTLEMLKQERAAFEE